MKDADKGHSIVKLPGLGPDAETPSGRVDFTRSDMELIRVYEDLMDILMKRGHEVFGIDQSPATVEQVQRRFAGRKGFKGAVRDDGGIALPDESADTAFMVEVVEHLEDRALANLLREAHRIVRPGGHLVLTTPNEENLRGFESMCPECGCIFHRVQHVRSWSATSLTEHVRRFGFEPVSAAEASVAVIETSGSLSVIVTVALVGFAIV